MDGARLRSVPVSFNDLLDAVLPTGRTRQTIDRLLVLKKQGLEAKHGPSIPEINKFLEMELIRLETQVEGQNKAKFSIAPLNKLFREMLEEVWCE